MEELSGEKQASPADRIKAWRFPKGKSGNPKGRPRSPITRIKEIWNENTELFDEWVVEYMEDKQNRRHVVEMVEGKPQQKIDHTTKGKELPQPILGNVQRDDSDNKNHETTEED